MKRAELEKIITQIVSSVLEEKVQQKTKKRLREQYKTKIDNAKTIKNLNPDSKQGRQNLIRDLSLQIKDLKARASILDKQVERAIAAETRQNYKEQLILMNDGLLSLKKEIEKLVKIYLMTVKQYEKQRGRSNPIAAHEK